MAKGRTETIHLYHCSLAFDMSQDGVKRDLEFAISQGPDIITTTESVQFANTIRNTFRAHGYRMAEHAHKACLMGVKTRSDVSLKDFGASALILPGKAGVYPDKVINWVSVKFKGISVFHHVAHWVPKGSANYIPNHQKITNALITQVRMHAKQGNVSFFAGDINEDDDPTGAVRGTGWNNMMRGANMMTIWDEKHVYPPTMGGGSRTIDVIGRYQKDDTEGLRYKIYNKQHSDHRPVSVFYEIEVAKAQNNEHNGPGGYGGGGGGGNTQDPEDPTGDNGGEDDPTDSDHSGDPVDDDFYATGGNISWADYLDNTIYDLPQAVDDSDTSNG